MFHKELPSAQAGDNAGILLRGLDRYLAEQTGLPVRVANEPLAAVLTGALVCLENLGRWRTALESSDDDVG